MKESTFNLVFGATLVLLVIFEFWDDPVKNVVSLFIAVALLLISSVCRAIEKNGKDK